MRCQACLGEGLLQGLDMGASRKKRGPKGRNGRDSRDIWGLPRLSGVHVQDRLEVIEGRLPYEDHTSITALLTPPYNPYITPFCEFPVLAMKPPLHGIQPSPDPQFKTKNPGPT